MSEIPAKAGHPAPLEPEDPLRAIGGPGSGPGGKEIPTEGPRSDRSVSGRTGRESGPFLSCPTPEDLKDLSLFLDEEFLGQLLLTQAPPVAVPLEAALQAGPRPARRRAPRDELLLPTFLTEPPIPASGKRGGRMRHAPTTPRAAPDHVRGTSPGPGLAEGGLPGRRPPLWPAAPVYETLVAPGHRVAHDTPAPGHPAARAAPPGPREAPPRQPLAAAAGPVTVSPVGAPARGDGASSRQPVLAGLASLALPGWGQSLNGQTGKALAFRIAALLALVAGDLLVLRGPLARLIAATSVRIAPPDPERLVAASEGPLAAVFFAGAALWLLGAYDALVVASALRPRRAAAGGDEALDPHGAGTTLTARAAAR